jgi:hypothetical protein
MDTPKYESKVNTKISKLKDDSINENYPLTQTIEKTQLYAKGVDVMNALVFLLLSTVYELLCFVLSLF